MTGLFFADRCDPVPAAAAPCSGVQLIDRSAGFEVVDGRGVVVARREHVEEALAAMRAIGPAMRIVRVADGKLVATKHRIQGAHIYESLWRMKQEPRRSP